MSNQNSEIALQDQFEKFMAQKEAAAPQPLEIIVIEPVADFQCFDHKLAAMFENFLGSKPGCECPGEHSHWCKEASL